jgi:mRNA interferase MazF
MGLVTGPSRFDVYLVNLDPTVGREIKKTRPAAVVSPTR